MSAIEVLLFILGGVVSVVSFLLPGQREEADREVSLSKDRVKELFEDEIRDAKTNIQEMVDETITYSVEKAERALSRITNEKISAVSEFSDTVLTDINKNRDEVMFLYDMLNDKQEYLKKEVSEANLTAKEAHRAKEELVRLLAERQEETSKADLPDDAQPRGRKKAAGREKEPEKTFVPFGELMIEKITLEEEKPPKKQTSRKTKAAAGQTEKADQAAKTPAKTTKRTSRKQTAKTAVEKPEEAKKEAVEEMKTEPVNNNERILQLYRMNKSHVDIAKELGLGVGEVKLVIDLYKGV